MPEGQALSLVVPATARGRRLDQYLADAAPGLSRSQVKALVDQGLARVDGAPARGSRRLKGGEAVHLVVPPPAPAVPLAENLPLTVLYEDRDLLVLDKAPGMVVHPAPGNRDGTLVNALLFHVKDLAGVGGQLRPGLVHRLDKDTSGCLVVAKNDVALRALQAAFKSRDVEKRYVALVQGQPEAQGTFRTFYGRHPVHRQRFTGKLRAGKLAVTHYRVLERLGPVAFVEATLETGRTHQIRVHFAEAGFPLLGDAVYGGSRRAERKVKDVAAALGRQALHAAELAFPHPRTGRRVSVAAPLPADFAAALAALRG